jgi:hypothetical protein
LKLWKAPGNPCDATSIHPPLSHCPHLNLPFRATRLSIFTLHSSKISAATTRISFQSLIMSSLVVWVEVTVNRITYLPLRDAGTAWRFPRWFNRFKSWKSSTILIGT